MTRRDLVEKAIGLEPQADDVDPQHPVSGENQVVLAQVVEHHVQALAVLRPVDLDDEPAAVPADVEVDPAPTPVAHDLPTRFWKAALSAPSREVELTQRLDTASDVAHDRTDEGATRPTAY